MNMEMRGEVYDMLDIDKISGEILLDGELKNVNFIKPTVLEAKLAKQLNIPPIKLEGRVEMESGAYNGMLRAVTVKARCCLTVTGTAVRNPIQPTLTWMNSL